MTQAQRALLRSKAVRRGFYEYVAEDTGLDLEDGTDAFSFLYETFILMFTGDSGKALIRELLKCSDMPDKERTEFEAILKSSRKKRTRPGGGGNKV
jgi:hypothetical protein